MLRKSAMYNLTLSTGASSPSPSSVAVAGGGGGCGGGALLGVDPSGVTPRTPEILNSLIAMTNPFDSYQQAHVESQPSPNQSIMQTRSKTASSNSCGSSITVLGQNGPGELSSPTG